MKILFYQDQERQESDPLVISNLIRKGWQPVPDKPEFDSETEKLLFDRENNCFSIISLNDELKRKRDFNISVWASISEGFLVAPENFRLSMGEGDRNLFAQMLALVKEALDLEYISDDTPQTIKDISGQPHIITTLRFRQIMVGYGFYYKNLWDSLQ